MPKILNIQPETYTRHAVHQGDRIWAETNCYTDVVIELLHALGHEPLALMAFTLDLDLELDQWTFFKPPPGDVETLYALSTCELAIWKPLVEHVEEHVAAGRPLLIELDSFYLPDTAGAAYGLAHVKSTVAVNEIDRAARRMGYFHNQGYHRVEGEDFDALFQINGLAHDRMLPPYVEFLKPLPRAAPLEGPALVEASVGLLRAHLRRLPLVNPYRRFQHKVQGDLDDLMVGDMDSFHAYSFATLRQFGACSELCVSWLQWLSAGGVQDLAEPTLALDELSRSTKALQFQLARAMMRRRPLDLGPFDALALRYDAAMAALNRHFG